MKIESISAHWVDDSIEIAVSTGMAVPVIELTQEQARELFEQLEPMVVDEAETYARMEKRLEDAVWDAYRWKERHDELMGELEDLKERWTR